MTERIAAGHGYRAGGRLGGNPLRDVVLAVAMVRKDQRAPRVFQEDYYPFARGLAANVHKRLAADPDWYGSGYYGESPVDDPTGATAGSNRVVRGGSWFDDAWLCRSADRSRLTPGYRNFAFGFRVASSSVDASSK